MRKLYILIILPVFLLANERLWAQCSVSIATNSNTTQLTCTDTVITLTANATGAGAKTYLWSTGATATSIKVKDPAIYTITIKDSTGCTASSSVSITKDTAVPAVTALAFPRTICTGGTSTLVAFGATSYLWQPGSLTGAVVSVSPGSTTTYAVTGTGSNGCVKTSTIRLVVHPLPKATISGKTSVCQNATQPMVTFTGSGGIKPYTFSYNVNGGPAQTITTAATDTAVDVGAPTGALGILNYNLISVSDSAGCTQTQSGKVTITILPAAILTSEKTRSICDNTPLIYGAKSSGGSTVSGWARAAVDGIKNPPANGTDSIKETLDNDTSQPVVVKYIFTLISGAGCTTTDSVLITVNPTPVINSIRDTTFCNGKFVSGGILFTTSTPGAIFSWTNSNPNIGLQAGGSGNILPFNAKNTTTTPITARITVKSGLNGCSGDSMGFTITVLPSPVLKSTRDTSICNGVPFRYKFISSAGNTNSSWVRPAVNGISNLAGKGVTDSINDTLYNTTPGPVRVKYIDTLSTGSGCTTIDSLIVTVNPTPVIDLINDTIFCNGKFASDGIIFTSSTRGAIFSWTNSNPNIGLQASGSGNILPFNAKNTTSIPITAGITVKSGIDGCCGDSMSFTITVLPAPLLKSTKDTSICNGVPFRYKFISSAGNTNSSWVRPAVNGISNPQGRGITDSINDTLYNTTPDPVRVKYIDTLSTGSGCTTIDSVIVTINPTPVIDLIRDTTFCNGKFVSNGILFTSSTSSAIFGWTNSNPNIGLQASGSGNILPFNAKNTTTTPITARITVKSGINGCSGDSMGFTITVLPSPVLKSTRDTSICNGVPFRYKFISSAGNTNSSWFRPAVNGISNQPGKGVTDSINDTLYNTTTDPVRVKYIDTLSTGSGCTTIDSVIVIVNPTPVIDSIVNKSYCNGYFVKGGIVFTSKSPNTSFSWTNSDTTIGLPSSGNGNIPAFIANNPNGTSVKDTVTVFVKSSGDSCAGEITRRFTITVLPAPALTSAKTKSICDSATFNYVATSSAAGTVFSWTREAVAGIKNPAGGGSDSTINETLDNDTTEPVTVKYIFKLSIDTLKLSVDTVCAIIDSVLVTVNPTPVLGSIRDTTFCNNYLVQPINFTRDTANKSFSWTCNPSIGFGTSGHDSNIPAFITNNQADSAIDAKVNVTISFGKQCQGNTTGFIIKVYPTPVLTSTKDTSVCDNAPFSYTAISSAKQTRFSWVRHAVTGIANPEASDTTATINEKLDNMMRTSVVVTYIDTLFTDAACFTIDSIRVTVNPTPVIDSIRDTTFCNGVYVGGIGFSSISRDSSFTWTSDTTIGFGSGGTGKIPSFIATNNGTAPIVDTVRVSITASKDQCQGNTSKFTITINPSPPKPAFTSLFGTPDSMILKLCKGSENINFDVNSPVDGISYKWTSTADPTSLSIRDPNDANTVISFSKAGTDTINVISRNNTGSCADTVSQIVQVSDSASGINRQLKIFLMQPGNLLTYPDNSLTAYQWGYNTINKPLPDTAFGPPIPVDGQLYQFFIPGPKFMNSNNSLNDTNYLYWVLLQNGDSCYTRVYYNGPYANRGSVQNPPQDNTVRLQVMPNPNSGMFEIALKGNIYGKMDARIYNSTGQVVFRKNFVKTIPEINELFNTNKLPGGLYYLVIHSSDLKKVVSRFVIQH